MDQRVFDEEQKHLTETYDKLVAMNAELEESIETLNQQAAEEKADILTNIRIDTADDEVQMESYGEMETWNRYIDTYNIKSGTMSAKLTKLKMLLESPYFARVTLQFAPDEEPENYYIGRSSISENGYDQLIVDWRSPIAETYYNQENGKTFYEVDGRRIDVDLLLRRQFELDKDQLKAYFDTQLAIEDPMLLASLSRQHSDKMQAITVTIQKEQNAIIRYPDVLLMGAEAANEKGLPTEALDYLEQVRAHARGTLTDVLPKVTTTNQSELRDAIRHERRVELGLEPDRFYDLVRWGIAKEVLQAAGKNYQDKNALLPLPQTEIDKSNGVLVQNPNY